MKLIRQFPLRPIRNGADYKAATAILDRLAIRDEGTLDAGEQDYFEVLTELVCDYDDEHEPVERGTPLQILKSLMEHAEMNSADLGRLIGNRATAGDILNGRRQLSPAHMFKLADRFGVNASLFLSRPPRAAGTASFVSDESQTELWHAGSNPTPTVGVTLLDHRRASDGSLRNAGCVGNHRRPTGQFRWEILHRPALSSGFRSPQFG